MKIHLFTGSTYLDILNTEIINGLKNPVSPFDVVVILPSVLKCRERRSNLFNQANKNGYLGQVFYTFHSFISQFAGEFGFLSDDLGKVALREIVNSSDLKYFKAVKDFNGFISSLQRLIFELGHSGVNPDEFEEIVMKSFGTISDKHSEILVLLKGYEKLKKSSGFFDRIDIFNKGLANFKDKKIKIKKFIMGDIYDISPNEKLLFEELVHRADETFIGVFKPERLTRTTKPVMKFIDYMKTFNPMIKDYSETSTKALFTFCEYFSKGYSSEAPELNLRDEIYFIESSGVYNEIKRVFSMIKEELTNGKPIDDIVIFWRSSDQLEKVIENISNEFGIPISFMNVTRKGSQFLKFITELFNLFRGDEIEGSKLFELLRYSYSFLNKEKLDILEIKMKTMNYLFNAKMILKLIEKESDADYNEIKDYILKIKDYQGEFRKVTNIQLSLDLFISFLEDFGLLTIENNFIYKIEIKNYYSIANLITALETFSELSGKYFSGTYKPGELFQMLLSIINSVKVDEIPDERSGRIRIFDFAAGRYVKSKSVYIIHLQESVIPSTGSADPFFKIIERKKINSIKTGAFYDRSEKFSKERYLFYLLLCSAQNRLVLSSCKYNEDGTLLSQSPFFYEVKKILPEDYVEKHSIVITPDMVIPEFGEIFSRNDLTKRVIYDLTSKSNEVFTYIDLLAGRDKDELYRLFSLQAFKFNSRLSGKSLLDFNKFKFKMSQSKLSKYMKCPFQFFITYIMQIEKIELGATPLTRGNFVHKLLEVFYLQLQSLGYRFVSDLEFEKAWKILENLFDNLEVKFAPGYPEYFEYFEREKTKKSLLKYLEYEYDFEKTYPKFIPWKFELNIKNFEIETGEVKMPFRGMIDRLDKSGDYFIVSDYKYTKTQTGTVLYNSIKNGENFQIPLYLYYIKNKYGKDPIGGELIGVLTNKRSTAYLNNINDILDRPIKQKQVIDYKLVIDFYINKAAGLYNMINNGDFEIAPINEKLGCDHCNFEDICRVNRFRIEEVTNIRAADLKDKDEPKE
ncbi:PD-(D/E)XK nuclease family protein [Candidatus Dependentiae bacterium]|nr:PD-(D/E)XK nuclease family protein [Candidatus Dependentiae bacterium]